jgi:putative transposase
MGRALSIRDDRSPGELRLLARRERCGRVAARLYAIANALEGMRRAEAARLAGMERQALRDAVVCYNADGLAGLKDRPKGHAPRTLSEAEEATFAAAIFSAVPTPRSMAFRRGRGPTCAAGWRRISARPTIRRA